MLAELPDDLRQQVFTHASWTDRRSDSYARLAFLGDSVLALSVTRDLYPRLEARRFGATARAMVEGALAGSRAPHAATARAKVANHRPS